MISKTTAIILAGGVGRRMGGKTPKQFLPLKGKPVIAHSISAFEKVKHITDIIIVSHKDHIARTERIIKKYAFRKVRNIVPGGATRQRSSYKGLKACPEGTEYVLIHDAARPLIDGKTINKAVSAVKRTGAVTVASQTTDTIASVKGSSLRNVLKRSELVNIETPQVFSYDLILSSHIYAAEQNFRGFTDDTSLFLFINKNRRVDIVKSSSANIKITDKASYDFVSLNIR